MTTPVCQLLGIEYPIVQAPMAAVPALAAAVSNAGALGMMTLTWSPDVAAVIKEAAALTPRPFGGNFVLTEDRHRPLDAALAAGLRKHDLDIGWAVETVLRSRAFFAEKNLGSRVPGPAEFLVGAARAL